MKIVLHACCGPCSTVPIGDYLKQGHELSVFFSNSNIHPWSEYVLRRDTAAEFAAKSGIEFVEGTYNPNDWIDAVDDCRSYGVERCSRCYRMRFREPAAYAAEIGADAIATSLTISPYQFTSAINRELACAASEHGVMAIESDFRERYHESVVLSREAGMYRQNYCGCMYSQVEAQEQRDQARARRTAAKAKRRLARGERAALGSMGQAAGVLAGMGQAASVLADMKQAARQEEQDAHQRF